MSNFAFLPAPFKSIAEAAMKAEAQVTGDPRAACFHARFALEAAVHWLYRHDPGLRMPYDRSLGALLHEPSFQNLLPEAVFQKARTIQKVGNQAVHSNRPIRQFDALQVVKELHHLCYWLTRTYAPQADRAGAAWSDERLPAAGGGAQVPRAELEALKEELETRNKEALNRQQERDALDAEVQRLRAAVAAARAEAEAEPDTHDYSEAETRRYLIDVELRRAGWPLDQERDREYKVTGMPNPQGVGYVDYVLWGDDGKPLGLVEAKRTTVDPAVGQQQAKLYADCLETVHGRRPVIFYTNGYVTWLWDDAFYPPRKVAGFYKRDELERLILRRRSREALDVAKIKPEIAGRYYQKRAVGNIFTALAGARRKGLLVMATGTGKTRTAIALVDALQRSNWVKRALFLADRLALVNQAVNAFKVHLPESSPVNLVTEKDKEGRVYVCTYPTMMGLIDENKGGEARFGTGHFDLVIIDEAHRSVYQRYREIFAYFDSHLLGLTATPREQVDKNTYELFDLESGVPTDAYELEEAVADGFLVPPKVEQVDLKFPQKGIDYEWLSEEEKEQWENLDWGDDGDAPSVPAKIDATAINNWLFNRDTVDKVLKHVMENGHKVAGGDRLGKTILFARNHDHAQFIEERFNYHYPGLAGHFERVIDNKVKYPQSLIEDFSQPDKAPHIAISVDMLDTGIDIPEVVNLVFFKPVYSKIKFWQMIGRGTRLCPDLFGPGGDKTDFRVFDFCFNFDFFRENPQGIEATESEPLGTRIFRARVRLTAHLDPAAAGGDDRVELRKSVLDYLHAEVAAMNAENFIVRAHLEAVERFRERSAWDHLTEDDRVYVQKELARLPNELVTDEVESRIFDLTALQMQLALAEEDPAVFEARRRRVVEIAALLEEKAAIPAVARQLEYLAALQETVFWEGIGLKELEDMRLRLRDLVPLLDRQKRHIVYSDFEDEVLAVREGEAITIPKMTGAQYAKKVEAYLREHLDHIAIHKLRQNEPLTAADLAELEATLARIGEDEGEKLLAGMLEQSEAPSLAHFVRRLVGMDRAAAQRAFSGFLEDRSLSPEQIRFIELVIDQLTARGIVSTEALYESPFSHLSALGPEAVFAGRENVIEGIFETLKTFEPVVGGKRGMG